jgi:hypothetical protein
VLGAVGALAWPRWAGAQADGSRDAPVAIRAGRWVEATEVGVARFQSVGGAMPDPIGFATPFPITAVAPHWSGKERVGASVEVSLSIDGADWGPWLTVGEDPDGGRPGRDLRRYGPPVLTSPVGWVRYRTFDADGKPAALRGLAWEYIDAAGPAAVSAGQQATPTVSDAGFTVRSRADWGADEGLRFVNGWEVWPPEYAAVTHAVVHHSDTAFHEDPLAAIRSIYYYHAVTRGWGDIGYNLLIDHLGNAYEGRVGGDGAVGGHALGYNEGTWGVCLIGRFQDEGPTPAMTGSLANALAWVTGRTGLDPFGEAPLKDIASLPIVCAHRDVNPTACPGDALYADLTPVRETVASLRETQLGAWEPSRFQAGGAATTSEEGVLLREGPGVRYPALASMRQGEPLAVLEGPTTADGFDWYLVRGTSLTGWAAADLLTPSVAPGDFGVAVGGQTAGPTRDDAGWPVGATVAVTGGPVRLRDAPAGAILDTLPDGAWLNIIGAPEQASGVMWYPVDTGLGTTGWVGAEFLRPA